MTCGPCVIIAEGHFSIECNSRVCSGIQFLSFDICILKTILNNELYFQKSTTNIILLNIRVLFLVTHLKVRLQITMLQSFVPSAGSFISAQCSIFPPFVAASAYFC